MDKITCFQIGNYITKHKMYNIVDNVYQIEDIGKESYKVFDIYSPSDVEEILISEIRPVRITETLLYKIGFNDLPRSEKEKIIDFKGFKLYHIEAQKIAFNLESVYVIELTSDDQNNETRIEEKSHNIRHIHELQNYLNDPII
ncbi:hypothetical protein [Elizabethkingia anophelis]|uniref:hypothetical protein n=1 Tax=Elizabethkingia anophelis TaxID=1117645 RepID=UPI000442C284|nr:hypothetical protein [Elizabethkingia anophelis]MDV3928727.1 hypothetical protein [Elizabethkingia anophelis]MDV4023695.1 hypothetical protein [Elizabethkingia anophelis]CDN74011.1 hypothetical protein E18064_270007 [Elizabethkingia anophelis]CDN77320.1 hypothetical protein E27107_190007 [Elizabethkingia anophelis]